MFFFGDQSETETETRNSSPFSPVLFSLAELAPNLDQSLLNSNIIIPNLCEPKNTKPRQIKSILGLNSQRIRLSSSVSSRFFAIQDKLGFNKASKTLEWLFTQCKGVIKQLHVDSDEQFKDLTESQLNQYDGLIIHVEPICERVKKARVCTSRRKNSKLVTTKRMRDQSRVRARERTKEKKRSVEHCINVDQGFEEFEMMLPDEMFGYFLDEICV